MKVLVSCAEASGDLIAAGVARALLKTDPSIQMFGMAGKHCREAGVDTRWDVSELGVMGLVEVIPKLFRAFQLMREIESLAKAERPDVALLVDAPDFNLRVAKRLKKLGIRVVYYVSPKLWAWRSGRVKTIRRVVDTMCCLFPFEEAWYRQRGVNASFVGHPLLEFEPCADTLRSLRTRVLADSTGPLLALLPGSRKFEVDNLLPTMLEAAKTLAARLPSLEVAIALAPTVDRGRVEAVFKRVGFAAKIVDGQARELLGAADAAVVASGTATLEAALMKVPTVVTYRASFFTALVFRLFVRLRFVSPPNILAGHEVVPELLQEQSTAPNIAGRVLPLLVAGVEREKMIAALTAVRETMGTPGAGERVAQVLLGKTLPQLDITQIALPERT